MRSKSMLLALVAMLMLGLFAAPASANKVKDKDGVMGGVKDSGVFEGDAVVGKFRTGCAHDGTGTVSGPGIGLPTQATKNAYFSLDTDVISAFKPESPGKLVVCGRLTKMHSAVNGGLGAACGASKGYDGRGTVKFPGKTTVWLKNLGWKVSVGGTLPVTGEANQATTEALSKDKPKGDFIVATVQAQGAGPCTEKGGDPGDPAKSDTPGNRGATSFIVVGNYEIANKVTGMEGNQNVGPECKNGLAAGCLNDPKKPGASG